MWVYKIQGFITPLPLASRSIISDPMARLQALVFWYTKILLVDILRFRISVIRVDVGEQDLFYGVRTDAEVF